MAKRRTRERKEKPKYPFLLSWEPPEAEKGLARHNVKGQFDAKAKNPETRLKDSENANLLAKDDTLASIKKDIVKSLILASLILGAEVVVYLVWF